MSGWLVVIVLGHLGYRLILWTYPWQESLEQLQGLRVLILFFNRFIGYKHALVEFWIRFDTAVDEQREKELREDNATFHTKPQLKTPWPIELHGSEVFTHKVFAKFQKEVIADRDNYVVESTAQVCDLKVTAVNEDGKKVRKVTCDTNTMIAQCSCMLFVTHGIPCRHIILVLRGALLNELPSHYVLKRWTANCKREVVLPRYFRWERKDGFHQYIFMYTTVQF